jgi:uncharacterized membrane protein
VTNIVNVLPAGRLALGLLVSLGVVACNGETDVEEHVTGDRAVEGVFLKGHAIFGHEVRSIRPCGQNEAVWAIDSTQLLWELHRELAPGIEPYEEVFAVVRGSEGTAPSDGFGADYPGSFIVDQVIYAAGEGFGCDLDLSRFHYRLSGNEPFWGLELVDTTAVLRRMGAPDQIWNRVRTESSGVGFRYVGESEKTGSVEVSLLEEPCRDSMSGAFHGYSASVSVAGETLIGCAIAGSMR